MTNSTIQKNIEKSAREMRDLVVRSKRKLLEMETLLSIIEIKKDKKERFKTVQDLLSSIK